MRTTVLPGKWVCTTCGTMFGLKYIRGVSDQIPREGPIALPATSSCPACGVPVAPSPADDAARAMEETIAGNGTKLYEVGE